jgi:TPR repeat protein
MLIAVLALLPASAFAGLTPEEVKAFKGYKVQAEKGDPIAQYNLGNSYYVGNGVVQDYVQAATWYRKAAIQGIASAQYNLGNSYRDGKGVVQDYVQVTCPQNLDGSKLEF